MVSLLGFIGLIGFIGLGSGARKLPTFYNQQHAFHSVEVTAKCGEFEWRCPYYNMQGDWGGDSPQEQREGVQAPTQSHKLNNPLIPNYSKSFPWIFCHPTCEMHDAGLVQYGYGEKLNQRKRCVAFLHINLKLTTLIATGHATPRGAMRHAPHTLNVCSIQICTEMT